MQNRKPHRQKAPQTGHSIFGTILFSLLAVLAVLVLAMSATAFAAGEDPTEEPGSKMIACADCNSTGLCMTCYGQDASCEACGGTFVCPM